MNRRTSITLIAALLSFSVFLSVEAFAQQGTAQEAQAMLTKAVAAVKADKTKAIDMFVKGEGGFLVGDLYPFCFETGDGKILATQAKQFIGTDVRNLKDGTGKPFGMDLYAAAKEGKITEVSYMFPKPGTDKTPVPKVSFVTAVGDLGCGVGYYK
jgi:signal transduction histidine kinase